MSGVVQSEAHHEDAGARDVGVQDAEALPRGGDVQERPRLAVDQVEVAPQLVVVHTCRQAELHLCTCIPIIP